MNWRVLLIGGSSGTGKTRPAQELSTALEISVFQIDDLRLSLHASTTEKTHPALHAFLGTASPETLSSPESVLKGYLTVAEAIEPAIRAVMSNHIDVTDSKPIIIEGDGMVPRLGSLDYLKVVDPWFQEVLPNAVKSVFFVEEDLRQLRTNIFGRIRGDWGWA